MSFRRVYTKNELERELNELAVEGLVSRSDWIIGGKDFGNPKYKKGYGYYLRKYDPIAFEVLYKEKLNEKGMNYEEIIK